MMVFGNIDEHSATGVAFTRDPQAALKSKNDAAN
jgi:hypothetical protein